MLRNPVAWFTARGVTVRRFSVTTARHTRDIYHTCAELGVVHKRTRPYGPQTNRKIERFHRTLADGWAFAKFHDNQDDRLAALAP